MSASLEASQVFGAIWGLCLIGALRARSPTFPFDTEWRSYAKTRHHELHRIRNSLVDECGLSRDVAEMLLADAPWTTKDGSTPSSDHYVVSQDVVDAELALMLGAQPGELENVKRMEPRTLQQMACVAQLAQLLGGILACSSHTKELQPKSLERLLRDGASIAHDRQPENTLLDAVNLWRKRDEERFIGSSPTLAAWIDGLLTRVVTMLSS